MSFFFLASKYSVSVHNAVTTEVIDSRITRMPKEAPPVIPYQIAEATVTTTKAKLSSNIIPVVDCLAA